MKQLLFILTVTFALMTIPCMAQDADRLNGKWLTKRKTDEGREVMQTIEIKGDKFIFEIAGTDGQTFLHAEGDFKAEKLGAFNSARFFKIRAGSSSSDLSDVDEEYNVVYRMDGDTLWVTTNFDKDREDRKPSVDTYHRTKAGSKAGTLVIDEIEMADTPQTAMWYLCFEAKGQGPSRRYYKPDKGYEKNQIKIPISLEVPDVAAGQKCSFKLQLDDVDEDACGDEPDQRSTGEFAASERGSQSFKPQDNLQFTLRWHLK